MVRHGWRAPFVAPYPGLPAFGPPCTESATRTKSRKASCQQCGARGFHDKAPVASRGCGAGALAQKDLQVAQDTEDKAKIDVHTAEQRIRILGGVRGQTGALIELHAPVSGPIVEQNISGFEGVNSLDNTPNLFAIADLSTV